MLSLVNSDRTIQLCQLLSLGAPVPELKSHLLLQAVMQDFRHSLAWDSKILGESGEQDRVIEARLSMSGLYSWVRALFSCQLLSKCPETAARHLDLASQARAATIAVEHWHSSC